MASNKLQLNEDKTEVLLIHSQYKNLSETCPNSLMLGDSEIKFSKEARNLGVTFTDTLDMNKHINNICRSAYCELRKISSVRHLLSNEDTQTLVCSYVLSKLDYCNALFSNLSKTHIDKLQKVQNSAARLIFKLKRIEHIKPFLKELHWLPISLRIQYKVALFCYKSLYDSKFPDYISNLLHIYKPSRNLRSANDNKIFIVPKFEKSFGKRSFTHAAPLFWNALPFEIRHAQSEAIFKKSLKTHLFRSFYGT